MHHTAPRARFFLCWPLLARVEQHPAHAGRFLSLGAYKKQGRAGAVAALSWRQKVVIQSACHGQPHSAVQTFHDGDAALGNAQALDWCGRSQRLCAPGQGWRGQASATVSACSSSGQEAVWVHVCTVVRGRARKQWQRSANRGHTAAAQGGAVLPGSCGVCTSI
jgi:hypothetical protein